MPAHLFVYGTLHPDLAPAEMLPVVRRLTPVAAATIRGTKLDLGEYPGLLIGFDHQDLVHGVVFVLPDDPEVLQALDDYEGFRPEDPAGSLFVRAQHMVTMVDEDEMLCWVYLWNGS